MNSNFNYFSIYALKPSNWPTLNACTDTTRGFLIHNQFESYILHHLYVLLHRSNRVPSFYHKFIAKISDYIDMDTPSHSMLYYLFGYGNIYVKHIYVKLKLYFFTALQCYDLGQRGYERKVQSMLVVYVERLLHRFFLPIVMMILFMAMIFLEFQTIRFSLSKKKEKDDSSSFPLLVPFVPICIYAFSFGIHVEIFILYFY